MLRNFLTANAALLLLLAGCASGPTVGSRAPAFSAENARGHEVTLAAYDDQVLILDFWAVW